jgi:hypothetical protein
MREVWAVVSDPHCGSTLGLCHPDGQQLDDGGYYRPSVAQGRLWSCWVDLWSIVKSRLKRRDKLIVAINGDIVDGDHHGTSQIVSRSLAAVQHEIAMRALEPAMELKPAAVVVIRGTETHVGRSAEHEERIARDLGAVSDPATGAHSWWHFQAESEGVLIDLAHHGKLGTLPWTRPNATAQLASRILIASAKAGTRHPDIAIRSHYHQWADSADNFPVRVIQTPGWQLSTAFVHRIAAGSVPEIGGLILTCESGNLSVEKVKFNWQRQKPWKLFSKSA